MIGLIIKLLQSDEWQGISEEVDIAKGKHSIPKNWKKTKENFKRWQKHTP